VKGRPHDQIPGSFESHLPADRLSACTYVRLMLLLRVS